MMTANTLGRTVEMTTSSEPSTSNERNEAPSWKPPRREPPGKSNQGAETPPRQALGQGTPPRRVYIIKPQVSVSRATPARIGSYSHERRRLAAVYAAIRMRIDMRRLSTPLTACWMSLAATPSSTSVDRGGSLICFEGDPFLEKNRDPFFSWSRASFLPKTIVPDDNNDVTMSGLLMYLASMWFNVNWPFSYTLAKNISANGSSGDKTPLLTKASCSSRATAGMGSGANKDPSASVSPSVRICWCL